MNHLQDRLCLVSWEKCSSDRPVIIVVKSDIANDDLPHCSALCVSCNTRPYHSYGPVARQVFYCSQPHNYTEVRRGLEGVMELGQVRCISPGALQTQTDKIILGCVATMTAGTNKEIIHKVLQNYAKEFGKLPANGSMRMPIIGTGMASDNESSDQQFRDIVETTISYIIPYIFSENENESRKLYLTHPLDYESKLLSTVIVEKAILLSILDKLNLSIADPNLIYGFGQGNSKKTCFFNESTFSQAMDLFDKSLNALLQGDSMECKRQAAKALQLDPELENIQHFIYTLASKEDGLVEMISQEAIRLAMQGKIREACCIIQSLRSMKLRKSDKILLESLKTCYQDYCCSALESRLLYENYIATEELLKKFRQGKAIHDTQRLKTHEILLENKEIFDKIEQKIPERLIENTFHIVIRKLMADKIEPHGAKRALDNLTELDEENKIQLTPENKEIKIQLQELVRKLENNEEQETIHELQKQALETMLTLLPKHGTLRLEATRYYLNPKRNDVRVHVLTKQDLLQAWDHLQIGFQENSRDYGILSYIGFMILLQGPKYFYQAEEFFTLFSKWIEYEVSLGKYGIRPLQLQNKKIDIPIQDPYTITAQDYYCKYQQCTQDFIQLIQLLRQQESTAAIRQYKKIIHSLGEIGRYDLAVLFQDLLGETWVALLCCNQSNLGSIPLPFGEISLELLLKIYKKIFYYIKYRRLSGTLYRDAIQNLLEKFRKSIFQSQQLPI